MIKYQRLFIICLKKIECKIILPVCTVSVVGVAVVLDGLPAHPWKLRVRRYVSKPISGVTSYLRFSQGYLRG